MLIAPLLIVIGVYMLDIIKLNLPKINFNGNKLKKNKRKLECTILRNLIFPCFLPYKRNILLRHAYANVSSRNRRLSFTGGLCDCNRITCYPRSLVLAYSVAGLGKLYNRIQVFEKWFRKVVAILFIAVGIYYAVMYYL